MRASHRHSVSVRPGPAPYPGGSADRPGRRGPVGGGPRGRRGHMGPGRDGRRGARSGAAVRVVDLGGRRQLHPRRGMGPLGRRHGFAADHVHRLRLVTADGRPHKIDADRAPELFWRCAVPGAASASSPSWSSRCSRSPACTGAGCSCPAPPPRSCCTCGAMGTDAARRGRHVGGAAAAAPTRVIGALAPWSLGGALPNFAGAEPPGALWSRVDRARLRCSRPSTRTACSPGPRCPDWPDSLHGRRAGTVGARVVRAVASPAGAGRPAAAARPARSRRCRAPRPSARCR